VERVSPVTAGDVFRHERAELVEAGVVIFASRSGSVVEFGVWQRPEAGTPFAFGAGMQIRRSRLLFLAVLLGFALSWYFGGAELELQLVSLANQPHVTSAFQDPISGKSDALMTLICFALFAPMAAFVAVLIMIFLVRGLEAVLVTLRGPAWFSAPLVGLTVFGALYASSPAWLPSSLYGLGLIARAYFVYSYGS
jgi:hypothetical protein